MNQNPSGGPNHPNPSPMTPISEHASPHNKYTIQKIIANESNKPFIATFRENHFWRFKIKCYDHHIISYMIDLVVISIKRRKLFVLWVYILTSVILGWFQDFEIYWLSKAIAVRTAFSLRQEYFALKLTRVFQTRVGLFNGFKVFYLWFYNIKYIERIWVDQLNSSPLFPAAKCQ